MKLYLSAYRIPNAKVFTDFVGIDASQIKIGLVSNAKDHKNPIERKEKIDDYIFYFTNLGFKVEEINLLKYKDVKVLLEKFGEFNVLWFCGGNTFCLRSAIEKSEAKEILKRALGEGIIYAGDSAGALIAGPTLKYFDRGDDPTLASEVHYDGLGFVDFSVLPHWGSQDFGEILKTIEIDLKRDGFRSIRLTDSDFLCIEDCKILNN